MKTSPHSCLQASIGLGLCCWFAASYTNQPHVVRHNAVYRKPPARFPTKSLLKWTAGDVEGDFERLESAIKLDNAQDDLLARTRDEMMDFMASSRKEVSAKILSFMQGPLLTSLVLTLAFRGIAGSKALAAIDLLSALQFAVCVVTAPLLLLTIQSRKRRYYETITLPRELQGIGEHYLRFLTFYKNPRLSCKDSVLCLLELWSFAVLPGLLYRPMSLTRRLSTRLAATASLRQYPAQAYELWYQQRHPLTGMVVALRTFEKLMLPTPMFIIDASLLMARLRPELIMRCYAVAFLFGTTSYLGFKHIKPQNKAWSMVARFRVPLSLCSASLAVGSILKHHQSFAGVLQRYMRPFDAGAAQVFSNLCLMSIVRTILATLSCAGVLWNLASIQDILRLAFTHNISLSTCLDDDGSTRTSAFEDKESFKWRYWSAWREPERISQSLRTIGARLLHWLFLEGSVDERLSKARREKKLPILERLKDDGFDDRTQWKTRAMDNVAERHRRSTMDGSVRVSSVWSFRLTCSPHHRILLDVPSMIHLE